MARNNIIDKIIITFTFKPSGKSIAIKKNEQIILIKDKTLK